MNVVTHTNSFLIAPLAMKSTFTPPTTICRRLEMKSDAEIKHAKTAALLPIIFSSDLSSLAQHLRKQHLACLHAAKLPKFGSKPNNSSDLIDQIEKEKITLTQ